MTDRQLIAETATRAEAADALGVSIRTVDRLIATGDLKAVKITRSVRIHGDSLRQLIEHGTTRSPEPAGADA